jgi:predicted amidohydrolase YtcJ
VWVVAPSAKASLVLYNGTIITMSRHKPKVQAVAIVNKKIAKVGTNDEVSPLIGPQTQVINLNGKTVIPGLIDTHIHLADFGKILSWLDLRNAKSILEVKEQIGRFVKKMPKEKWVIGHGLGNINLKASILDEVAPENPIILYHQKGRTCIVNSKALKMAGITKDTLRLKAEKSRNTP